LFAEAMAERKQIVCTYHGYRRELCPIILGHSQGHEKALTYQLGGQSGTGLAARRPVAVPLSVQGSQCPASRRAMARRR